MAPFLDCIIAMRLADVKIQEQADHSLTFGYCGRIIYVGISYRLRFGHWQ